MVAYIPGTSQAVGPSPTGASTTLIADESLSKSLPSHGAQLPSPVGTVPTDKAKSPVGGSTSPALPSYTVSATTSTLPTTVPTTVMTATTNQPGVLQGSAVRRDSSLEDRDQALRQRLKSAMANVGS